MQDFDYYSPQTLEELTAALKRTGGRIVAGGTDVIPRMRQGLFSTECLIDASHIDSLRFINEQDDLVIIGALTTHQEIVESQLLQTEIPSLVEAASLIGCHQTRYRGTIGGNIANASPAADTVPPLLTYDAEVRLVRVDGERSVQLTDLLVGPGETRLAAGEVIHSVLFHKLTGAWGASFLKLGLRKGMAISVTNVAVALVLDSSGNIADARIALGSVAPTVVRSPQAEAALLGQEPTPDVLQKAAVACRNDISPISDVRSGANYRVHTSTVLVRRALETCVAQAFERSQA